MTPIGPAKISGGGTTMPMVSGTVNVPTMGGTMKAKGGLQYSKGSKIVRVSSYIPKHHGGAATLTAIVNGHRLVIASPNVHMSGHRGTMSGGLAISATWARTINRLVGMHVVHAGETVGQLSMAVKTS